MFLLVSVRHVGAHSDGHMALDGHQHGVSIKISYFKILWKHFLGYLVCEIFLWPESWRGSLYILSWLYLFNGCDFYFDLFWMARYWKPAIKAEIANQIWEFCRGSLPRIVQLLSTKIVQISDTSMKLSQITKGPKGNIFWCRAKPIQIFACPDFASMETRLKMKNALNERVLGK